MMYENSYGFQIQELLPEVQKLCRKYTGKASTSVTYETAAKLMEAVLYFIRETEEDGGKQMPDTKERCVTASQICEEGYRLVLEKTKKAGQLYSSIITGFQSFGNKIYYDTIVKGMQEFFRWYDAKLNPQEHILTLDYPLLVSLEDQCGIDRIWEYLKAVKLEQRFLGRFQKGFVIRILRENRGEYEEGIENVCEGVLEGIFKDYWKQAGGLSRYSETEMLAHMEEILWKLMEERYDGDRELYEYLKSCLRGIGLRIKNAAVQGDLWGKIQEIY